jgi:hypothetical protein
MKHKTFAVVGCIGLLLSATSAASAKKPPAFRPTTGWSLCFLGTHVSAGTAELAFAYRVGSFPNNPNGSQRNAEKSLDIWAQGRWKELGDARRDRSFDPSRPIQIDRLAPGIVDRKSPFGTATPKNVVARLRQNSLTLHILKLTKLGPGTYRVRVGDYKDFNVPTASAQFEVEADNKANIAFDQLSPSSKFGGAGGGAATANPTVIGSGGAEVFLPDVKQDSAIHITSYAAPDADTWAPFDVVLPPTTLSTGVVGVVVPALPEGAYQIETNNSASVESGPSTKTTTVALFVNDVCKSDVQPVDPIA